MHNFGNQLLNPAINFVHSLDNFLPKIHKLTMQKVVTILQQRSMYHGWYRGGETNVVMLSMVPTISKIYSDRGTLFMHEI